MRPYGQITTKREKKANYYHERGDGLRKRVGRRCHEVTARRGHRAIKKGPSGGGDKKDAGTEKTKVGGNALCRLPSKRKKTPRRRTVKGRASGVHWFWQRWTWEGGEKKRGGTTRDHWDAPLWNTGEKSLVWPKVPFRNGLFWSKTVQELCAWLQNKLVWGESAQIRGTSPERCQLLTQTTTK